MGRPRLHDERTERELLKAAESLLSEGGGPALSVRRVAEAAGTTPRAIYTVFGGKEGLLRALFREAFKSLAAELDALPLTSDPVADLVTAGAVGFRRWARTHPDLFRLAFEEQATPVTPTDSEVGVEAFGRLVMRARRCVAAGVLPAGSELEASLLLHAFCEGMAGLEARARFPPLVGRDLSQMWRDGLTAMVRGFSGRPPEGA